MVHAFTCMGITETQYRSLSKAAGMGSVMDKTVDTSVWLSLFFFFFKPSYVLENFDVLLFAFLVQLKESHFQIS